MVSDFNGNDTSFYRVYYGLFITRIMGRLLFPRDTKMPSTCVNVAYVKFEELSRHCLHDKIIVAFYYHECLNLCKREES